MGQRRRRQPPAPPRPRWRPTIESLESRRVLSGIPLGALPDDTAEYLLGRVAVTPVFLESDGTVDSESQDWTSAEISGVLQKIHEGMDWWVDTLATLDTVHSLEFVYDESYARDPVETWYEPIDRTSEAFSLYVGNWLTDLGYGEEGSLENAIRAFNHQQRLTLDTDWAFTIVVVDASDDPDGQFANGGSFGQAFAFAGGMFMVVPSTRPASTFAHEMGHIFWARDEYSGGGSWSDHRGYYDTQNLNASDNPQPGFQQQPSVMSSGLVLAEAYADHASPASTFAFVGWQDSDGDGVFDVLDVPLHLEGSGHYDVESELYSFDGAAWAVALENLNPAGLQNDITLNRISRLEYSVDGGDFVTAVNVDSQQAEVSFSVSLPSPFQSIRVRAVDDATGMTSPLIDATPRQPGYVAAAAAGFAFLDENSNGVREADEPILPGVHARLTAVAGRDSLPGGTIDPADFAAGALPGPLPGVTLVADGPLHDGRVGVASEDTPAASKRLASYDLRLSRWDIGWTAQNALVAEFAEPTGDVRIEVVGIEADSIGRMEAYDASGNYLFRTNTPTLQPGETGSLRLQDPQGRIAKVRVFGHARTEVALGRFEFGPRWNTASDAHGVIRFANLSDGTYDVELDSDLVIHQVAGDQFAGGSGQITVSSGSSPTFAIPLRRVDSPWNNVNLAEDVDQNGNIEPLDALRIINDLNRFGSRSLSALDPLEALVDTNNDGWVTPADALSVINALNRQLTAQEGEAPAGEGNASPASQVVLAAPSPADAGPAPSSLGGFSAADAVGSPFLAKNSVAGDLAAEAEGERWADAGERQHVQGADFAAGASPPARAVDYLFRRGGTTSSEGRADAGEPPADDARGLSDLAIDLFKRNAP